MLSMNDHHLIKLMEECAEVVQRASKQLLFGRNEVQPGQLLTNSQRLRQEIIDVMISVHFLEESNQIEKITQVDTAYHYLEKYAKIAEMVELAREMGRLE